MMHFPVFTSHIFEKDMCLFCIRSFFLSFFWGGGEDIELTFEGDLSIKLTLQLADISSKWHFFQFPIIGVILKRTLITGNFCVR